MSQKKGRSKHGLYRSRHGVILGVCRGVADYFDFSVFWARVITVILFLITGFWPAIGLYILAAFLMKSDPVISAGPGKGQVGNKGRACGKDERVARLKRKWHHLDKRIRKMEDKITSRELDWNTRSQW